ncbi:MAG: hypothetical protein IPM34_13895 [Saprospiraceae bacterium]|nr:hypothetical protein [Saprospiraceae bacterium]
MFGKYFNAMVWLFRILVFFIACFFILPWFQVEDPFRSLALRFFSRPATAWMYQHDCKPDRVYLFEYYVDYTLYQQRYDGYIESLDHKIPENLRCSGPLSSKVEMPIRFFPYFRYWSEPEDAIRPSLILFIMLNGVKFGSVFLLVLTFVRRKGEKA